MEAACSAAATVSGTGAIGVPSLPASSAIAWTSVVTFSGCDVPDVDGPDASWVFPDGLEVDLSGFFSPESPIRTN